ncbi:hypothetical protein L0337_31940 [candidate division KSB1 bacterium]|nr:hypothetical protein [candidate division KSB1 bacterium]
MDKESRFMHRLSKYLLSTLFITSVLQVHVRAQITPEQFWQDAQKVKREEKSKASHDKLQWIWFMSWRTWLKDKTAKRTSSICTTPMTL